MIANIIWYKNRLLAMSPLEIIHRINEQIKRKKDKYYKKTDFSVVHELPIIAGLKKSIISNKFPQEIIEFWQKLAQDWQKGSFFLLNQNWHKIEPIAKLIKCGEAASFSLWEKVRMREIIYNS